LIANLPQFDQIATIDHGPVVFAGPSCILKRPSDGLGTGS